MAEPKGRRKRAPKGAGNGVEPTQEQSQSVNAGAESQGDGSPALRDYSEEEVRRRAYELYQSRGGGHGSDFEDWLRAEREVRERRRPAVEPQGAAGAVPPVPTPEQATADSERRARSARRGRSGETLPPTE
jgi:hypothetical protein